MSNPSIKQTAPQFPPPPPMIDEFIQWMDGQWEGRTEVAGEVSLDLVSCEPILGQQAVLLRYEAVPQSALGQKYGSYQGIGIVTMDPLTAKASMYWVDNARNVFAGPHGRDGDVAHFDLQSRLATTQRTVERGGADTMVMQSRTTTANGTVLEGRTTLTRKK